MDSERLRKIEQKVTERRLVEQKPPVETTPSLPPSPVVPTGRQAGGEGEKLAITPPEDATPSQSPPTEVGGEGARVEPKWNERKLRDIFGRLMDLQKKQAEAKSLDEFNDLGRQIEDIQVPDSSEVRDADPSLLDLYSSLSNDLFELRNKTKTPEPEIYIPPEPAIPPKTAGEIEKNLAEAREKYVKAQQKREDFGIIREKLGRFLKGESLDQVQKALGEAEDEYKKYRTEFVGASVDKFLEEKFKLLDGQIQERKKEKKNAASEAIQKAYDKYKALGNKNVELVLSKSKIGREFLQRVESWGGKKEKISKIFLRGINARTAISFGLLGVGVYAGMTSAVGIGAIATRRWLAGLGSGVSTYDLTRLGSDKLDRLLDKNSGAVKDSQINFELADMEGKALLRGQSIDDLKNNPKYKELLDRKIQLLKKYIEDHKDLEDVQKLRLQRELDSGDKILIATLGPIKFFEASKKGASAVAGGAVGLIVGSGLLAEVFGRKTSFEKTQVSEYGKEAPKGPPAPKPETLPAETPSSSPPYQGGEGAILHHGEGTGAKIEIENDGRAVVSAGRRGIEGALLDLEETNRAQYDKFINWLRNNKDYISESTDPLANDDHRLIHRFILKYAEDHDNMDPKQLNHILEGKLKIGADGTLTVEEGDITYMEPRTATDTSPAPLEAEPPLQITGEGNKEATHFAGGERGAGIVEPPLQPSSVGEGKNYFHFSAEPQTPTPEQSIQDAISAGKQPPWDWQRLQEDIRARDEIQNPETDADIAQAPSIISAETSAQLSEELQKPLTRTAAIESSLPEPPKPDRVAETFEAGREQMPNDYEQEQINESLRKERIEVLRAAKQNFNTSEALKSGLGEGDYQKFLQAEFGLAPIEVDSVQNYTVANFVKQFEESGQEFKTHYTKLMDFLRENKLESPGYDNKTIREVVYARAAIWKAE